MFSFTCFAASEHKPEMFWRNTQRRLHHRASMPEASRTILRESFWPRDLAAPRAAYDALLDAIRSVGSVRFDHDWDIRIEKIWRGH
jgi:hypothetical protein